MKSIGVSILLLLIARLGFAVEADRAQLLVTPDEFRSIEARVATLCDAIRWRMIHEQRRVRDIVEQHGQDSYDLWPAEMDSVPEIDPEQVREQVRSEFEFARDRGLSLQHVLAKLDSAERGLRSLDDLSFVHFVWEPYSLLGLLFPETCFPVPPNYPDPCHAAPIWDLMLPHLLSPSLHIFILIPAPNGIWSHSNLQFIMASNKIVVGLFRPKLRGFDTERPIVWSGITFGVLAGFDIAESHEPEGGGIKIESISSSFPTGLNVLIFNRIHHNSASSEGGGVYAELFTVNVLIANTIENNTSGDEGGGFYADEYSVNVLIGNKFVENSADVRGGGASFHPYTTAYMRSNKFSDNSAPIGGGVYLPTGFPVIASRNTYRGNRATIGAGGGMYDDGSLHVDFEREYFSGNEAATVSGGYHQTTALPGGHTYELNKFRFKKNHAPTGGAIYITPDWDRVRLLGCTFDGNWSSTEGGAVWLPPDQTDIAILGCNFLANHAPVGSAMFFVKDPAISSVVSLYKSTFSTNYVSSANGGACYFVTTDGLLDVRIDSSSFTDINQTPYNGGALFVAGPNTHLDVHASFFKNNQADRSGAIWAPAIPEFRIRNSTFMGNYATHGGGAVWYPDGDYTNFTIDSSWFEGNFTPERGGALWVNEQANILITSTVFSGNHADSGGAIAVTDSGTAIRLLNDSLFSNLAAKVGGALYIAQDANVDTLSGCVFSGNIVESEAILATITEGLGGAIYLHSISYDEDIVNCDFYSNDATYGGAIALDTFRVPFRIVGCNFVSNGADRGNAGVGSGGAIFVNGRDLDITIGTPEIQDANFFSRNTAEDGGAIAVFGGSSPRIWNNLFEYNKADRNADGYGMGGAVLSQDDRSDLIIGGNAVLNEDNTFVFNIAGTSGAVRHGRGGAIATRRGASPVIRGNHLYFNGATHSGAGIADSTAIVDSTIIGGVNDDEIVQAMHDPVPFDSVQWGNRIFNTCGDVPVHSAILPELPAIGDSITICCCYNGSGTIFQVAFPALGWLPDSSFEYADEADQEFLQCVPIDDPEIEITPELLTQFQSEAVPDSVRWPAEQDSFCFGWPIEMPLFPDSDWVPDTVSWRIEQLLSCSWGRRQYGLLGIGGEARERNPLDSDLFVDTLRILDPCDITGNYVPLFGGGISVEGVARPVILGNLLDHNCADSIGGGIWVDTTTTGARIGIADTLAESQTTDHKNFIQRNAAPDGGGVGFTRSCWSVMQNNVVGGTTGGLGNLACDRGGGFYITGRAHPVIGDTALTRNNLVRSNRSYLNYGGGFAINGLAYPLLRGNRIFNNRCGDRDPWLSEDPSTSDGGGVGVFGAAPDIQYNWIIDNFACDEGGGISLENNSGPIRHNTIAVNDAFNGGSGVRFAGTMNYSFRDNNVVSYGPWESSGIYTQSGGLPETYAFNNVFSLTARDFENSYIDPDCYHGNSSVPALFVDPDNNDYRLATNSLLQGAASDGGDIGWNYPLSAPINLSLDTLWVFEGQSIQSAINLASFGDIVLVDSGEYQENLTLKSGVIVKGIDGPDSTRLSATSQAVTNIFGDSLHHTTSLSGFWLSDARRGVELTGNSRPYLFQNVFYRCDSAIVQRDSSVSWIQHTTFNDNDLDIYNLDSLAVISHNIFTRSSDNLTTKPSQVPDVMYPHARRNNFDDGNPTSNPQNISADPRFRSPSDFHLQCNSPCRPGVTVDSTLIGAMDYELDYVLTGDRTAFGGATDTVSIPFEIVNPRNTNTTVSILLSDSMGWLLPPTAFSLTLPARRDCVFTARVLVPISTPIGMVDTVGCRASMGANVCDRDSVRGFVVVDSTSLIAQLIVRRSGNNAVLNWLRFGGIGCTYGVYSTTGLAEQFTLIGQTTDTTYTDAGAISIHPIKFYRIEILPHLASEDKPDFQPVTR